MYAVIFKAISKDLDNEYFETAEIMRNLAMTKYGCTEFSSCSEGKQEIAISYWESMDQIKAWKNNPEHIKAQKAGRGKWYASYQVQIVEVLHEYGA